jgi:hypothetical protein
MKEEYATFRHTYIMTYVKCVLRPVLYQDVTFVDILCCCKVHCASDGHFAVTQAPRSGPRLWQRAGCGSCSAVLPVTQRASATVSKLDSFQLTYVKLVCFRSM